MNSIPIHELRKKEHGCANRQPAKYHSKTRDYNGIACSMAHSKPQASPTPAIETFADGFLVDSSD